MLVAKNERGQLVRASDAQRTRGYRCPECDAPLVLRQGSRVPHLLTGLNRVVSWHKGRVSCTC